MTERGTRDLIIAAAARLYADRGYEGVSMRNVAAEVGVGPANLYHHFKDKDALIRETLIRVFGARAEAMLAELPQKASAEEKLRWLVEWFVRQLWEDRVFARLLCREFMDGTPERLELLTKTVFDQPFRQLSAILAECARELDPLLSAVSVSALILGHYQLAAGLPYLPEARTEHSSPETVSRHVIQLLERVVDAGRLHRSEGRTP